MTGYETWRSSYQDSEQAARAAYAQMMLHFLRVLELEQQFDQAAPSPRPSATSDLSPC